MPVFRDQLLTAGIMVATTGVLLRNPLNSATGVNMRHMAARTFLGRPSSRVTINSAPPEALMPAATTNIAATVTRPSLAKPARASVPVSTPKVTSKVSAPIMTTWGLSRVSVSVPRTPATSARENQPCQSMTVIYPLLIMESSLHSATFIRK